MPLYEYKCDQCGERSEILQSFQDPPHTQCPKCGGTVKKLFSAPAIQFKGSGFYKTDYASKSSTPATSSSGETKTETKTEAKSESKSDTSSSSSSSTTTATKAD
ncbi:MAG TPA: FmdB family zinc ribbon protein [Thermoanaerobaculia bacterium]|nr:FmdB family zinc ribbon protein [Thermoanaerobaculia bacterium]